MKIQTDHALDECERCEMMDLERLDLVLAISMLQKELDGYRNKDGESVYEARKSVSDAVVRDCKSLLIRLRNGEPVSDTQLQSLIQRLAVLEV